MRAELRYGEGTIALDVPPELDAELHTLQRDLPAAAGEGDLLAAATELDGAGLEREVRGRRVALLLADGTRDEPREAAVPLLLRLLEPAAEVRAFLTTGTHAPDLPENVALARQIGEMLRAAGRGEGPIVHDARAGVHVSCGRTRRGTAVEIDAAAADCDVFLCLADMKYHYFAGYSNPVKHVLPGIGSFETARGNHSLALDPRSTAAVHPWHPDPGRRGNPLAQDMVEALGMFLAGRPFFALALVSAPGRLLWCGGGPAAEVAGRGMLAVDRWLGLELAPRRFLVVSAGGHPYDESLYLAQRALELTGAAVRSGGEVLLLAQCANGIGPPSSRENFLDRLAKPLSEVLADAEREYVMYGHKPVKLARYLQRVAAVHLVSDLPPEEVRRVHLEPAPEPARVLERWAARADPGDGVLLIDDASKVAVRQPSGTG